MTDSQGSLVLRQTCLASQHQHPGGGVIAAGDAVLVGEAEYVLSGHEIAGDLHRRAGQIGAVNIGDGDRRIDRRRGLVLGVTQRAGMSIQHRRVVHRPDVDDRRVAAGQRCPAAAGRCR